MSRGPRPPLYDRVLRLRHIQPSTPLRCLLFECMIALGALLALAELVSWWAVPLLPAVVAGMVKLNDLVAAAPRPVSWELVDTIELAIPPRRRFRRAVRRRFRLG
jgi:hypothetical protein